MKLPGLGGTAPVSMIPSEWRKPFNLSIGLHILIVIVAMLMPSMFDRKPRLPEIYTVNLFTATEVSAPPPAAPKPPAAKKTAPKPAVRQIKPEVKKPAVSIKPAKPEVSIAPKPAVTKPISLKPVKLKKKVGKTKVEEEREKARLDLVVKQLQTQAAQQQAKAQADQAAKDAVSKLADALKASPPASSTAVTTRETTPSKTVSASETTGLSGPKGTGVEPDFYLKQYYSAVYQKIHDHWVLPDLQNWDNSLEAILVITIRKDGTVADNFFEKKSDNIYFNQFVLKAVREASPLPPFPGQLGKNSIEIGLRFKPGELY